MVDVVDPASRSRMMAGIRGRDTKPELTVRSYLHRAGLRFRLHTPLPGKPDLVLPKYSAVVFVHGCYWHRHTGCRLATTPSTNVQFWQKKFANNVRRDADVAAKLRALGWRVFIVWQCNINEENLGKLVSRIRRLINDREPEWPD